MHDGPLAYFVTWTVYGTHLQGDQRGWRKRRKGEQSPQDRLAAWRRKRLHHSVLLLGIDQREAVENAIQEHCDHRQWKLWAANCRSNHVHAVVSAINHVGNQIRDHLKANATRVLRARWLEFVDRPVWTTGGDWQCVQSDSDLEIVMAYVTEAQDRKDREPGTGR